MALKIDGSNEELFSFITANNALCVIGSALVVCELLPKLPLNMVPKHTIAAYLAAAAVAPAFQTRDSNTTFLIKATARASSPPTNAAPRFIFESISGISSPSSSNAASKVLNKATLTTGSFAW